MHFYAADLELASLQFQKECVDTSLMLHLLCTAAQRQVLLVPTNWLAGVRHSEDSEIFSSGSPLLTLLNTILSAIIVKVFIYKL